MPAHPTNMIDSGLLGPRDISFITSQRHELRQEHHAFSPGGRGAARAEDAQGTPTQSHISPRILSVRTKMKAGDKVCLKSACLTQSTLGPDVVCASPRRCGVNAAHTRQSRPDYGIGLSHFSGDPFPSRCSLLAWQRPGSRWKGSTEVPRS